LDWGTGPLHENEFDAILSVTGPVELIKLSRIVVLLLG